MKLQGIDFTGIAMICGLGVAGFLLYKLVKTGSGFSKSAGDLYDKTVAAASHAVTATLDAAESAGKSMISAAVPGAFGTMYGGGSMIPPVDVSAFYQADAQIDPLRTLEKPVVDDAIFQMQMQAMTNG
jgi:hypothetical protein